MRLLVVEVDRKLASFIVKGCEEAGFAVDHCDNGEDGLVMAGANSYAVALVALTLPRLDGLSVVRELRAQKNRVPIVMLSAKRTVADCVKGLQMGADDYLTKPFAIAELMARVQALVRRSSRVVEPASLSAGDLTLDLLSRRVTRAGRELKLHAREFSLLEYLLRNRGRIVSKAMILGHVWDYSFDPKTNVVDVLVCRVRKKVERNFPTKLIRTVRGMGYILEAP